METTDQSTQSKLESFFEKLEQLTKVQRILISVGVFVLIIGTIGWYFYRPKFVDLDNFEKKLEYN